MKYEMGNWVPSVPNLPIMIEQDDPQGGVLRPWVREMPLRFQGVLLTAIRGCDVATKEDKSKSLTRMVRRVVLNPADPRESTYPGGFFGFTGPKLIEDTKAFLNSLDSYPLHYVMHLTHACEVIGYRFGNSETATVQDVAIAHFFRYVYFDICYSLHLNPETESQLEYRLTMDRVAAKVVEINIA